MIKYDTVKLNLSRKLPRGNIICLSSAAQMTISSNLCSGHAGTVRLGQ